MGPTLGAPGNHDSVEVNADSGAFPALGPEFIERFLSSVERLANEFDDFFGFLEGVHEGENSVGDVVPKWATLEDKRKQFCKKIYDQCGHYGSSPFSAFVRYCFHEISNFVLPLMAVVGNSDSSMRAFFNHSFVPNRAYIKSYFELLRNGQPALVQVDLHQTLEKIAGEHGINLSSTPSYDRATRVRIAPATLSAVLSNLERGANQANGGGATIHLVLDSGFDADEQPWVHLYFLSDVHTTALEPERFQQLLMRRPEKGQHGGRGLYLSELLLQAQRSATNVFYGSVPQGTPRTSPCLQFRKDNTDAPLSPRDHEIIRDHDLSTNFLFTLDLTGMRVRTPSEQFYAAFDATLRDFPDPLYDDPLVDGLIDRAERIFLELFLDGRRNDFGKILDEIDPNDDALRFSFSCLVSGLRQRLEAVSL